MRKIHELKVCERPRERLLAKGALYLSDTELLAIILGSGTAKAGVHDLSKKVLEVIDTLNGNLTADQLSQIDGIGNAKATLICASLEFARRRIKPEGTKVNGASDVYPLIRHFSERKQEHFICLSLNGGNEVISIRVVTIGLLNSTQIHPREVFSDPIAERAASVILAHNHPSGNLTASPEDIAATKRILEAGELLGIKVLDHIIFTRHSFMSMKDKGICFK